MLQSIVTSCCVPCVASRVMLQTLSTALMSQRFFADKTPSSASESNQTAHARREDSRTLISWRSEGHSDKLKQFITNALQGLDSHIESQGEDAHLHMVRHWQVCRNVLLSLVSLLEFKKTQPLNYVFTGRKRGDSERNVRQRSQEGTIAFSVARTTKNVLRSFIVNRKRFLPTEINTSLEAAVTVIQETYFD